MECTHDLRNFYHVNISAEEAGGRSIGGSSSGQRSLPWMRGGGAGGGGGGVVGRSRFDQAGFRGRSQSNDRLSLSSVRRSVHLYDRYFVKEFADWI